MPIGMQRINSLSAYAAPAPAPGFTPFADANAAYLRLALPFNSVTQFNDVSHLVSGSPNSVATTVRGPQSTASGEIVTADSKHYGSSYYQKPGGGGQYKLRYNLQQSWFPHTTNYTMEFWIRGTRTSNNSWFISNADIGGRYLLGIYVSGSSATNIGTSDYRLRILTGWHHIVIQRDYWYLDGVRKGTVSEPTLSTAISTFYLGAQNDGDANDFEGYINDFRLYIGINKYSGTSITPPGPIGS